MVKQLLAISLALLSAAVPAHAAPPVRTMYTLASEKEQTARAALADRTSSDAALKSVHAAIASYESLVRRHPTSSYSDNALWQAGRLALDAFDTFGEPQDRDTGVRLLRWLASEYPTSRVARQVPDVLAKLDRPRTPAAQTTAARATQADKADAQTAGENRLQTVPPAPAVPRVSTVPEPSSAAKQPASINVPAAPPVTVAKPVAKPATITGIRRAVLPDVVRVIIALDYEVPFHEERITGPSRIFIDFPTTRAAPSLIDQTLRFDDDGDVVRQVRIGRHPNSMTRVVLDATDVSSYSVYPLYSPYRLVIDCLRPTRSTPRLTAAAAGVTPLPARSIRLKPEATIKGMSPNVIERIPASPAPLASRRLVPRSAGTLPLSTPGATAALTASYVPLLSSRIFPLNWGQRLPLRTAGATLAIAQALAPEAPIVVASTAPSQPSAMASAASTSSAPPVLPSAPSAPSASAAPSASSSSPLSMARQLGLGVSRIVIDPGHGGHDPGAKGKGGVTEAELVLDVSRRLEKLLEKVRGVEVILTRDSDCFVPLQERTAIANREGADLFLSIHANASANDQAHGVETYFLNFANNLGAASVAARENAASGQSMGALTDFVKAIALNNKLDESRDFAALVQQSMVDRLRPANKSLKNLGVKQAPFVVLIGASMPSVLAEISFVTNPQEAKLLKSNAYRQSIAEALFNAVRKYQTSLTPRTVASQ